MDVYLPSIETYGDSLIQFLVKNINVYSSEHERTIYLTC